MFGTLGRSWEFAKVSYRIVWEFKSLLLFPLFSGTAAIVVSASFLLPLWGTGTLEQWATFMDEDTATSSGDAVMYVTLFLFYFANYFVIVFFNAALTACAMRVINGEPPSVGYGLSMASKRLPQIIGWAILSAIVGVVLKAIENANEKAGHFIAAILGMAWTALTYFIVPYIVLEGAGPIEAFKRSTSTLKDTWGEALVGNFSLGFLNFLLMLPVLAICALLIFLAGASQSTALLVAAIALAVVLVMTMVAVSSAADVIFKAVLFNYATGKSIPQDIDTSSFDDAFAAK